MSNKISKNGLFETVSELVDYGRLAVMFANYKIRQAYEYLTSTDVMKKVAVVAAKTFEFTVINAGKGLVDGVVNLGSLGFEPIKNFKKTIERYKSYENVNPFYIAGNVASGAIALPLALVIRGGYDLTSGLVGGVRDAIDNKLPSKGEINKFIHRNGQYLSIPTYIIGYAVAKPIEFTARQVKDGVKLGYEFDVEGFKELIKSKDNTLAKVPFIICSGVGFAIGASAKGIKYPVENVAKGFGDGFGTMISYEWFHKKDFFTSGLTKKTNNNIIHNTAMVPGAVAGFALGQVTSTVGGLFYGLANGALAAADFKNLDSPLNVLGETSNHQKVVMIPAHLAYSAGAAVGFAASLVTKPFHSKQNFENTALAVAVPLVAPYYLGKQLLSKNDNSNENKTTSDLANEPPAVVSPTTSAAMPSVELSDKVKNSIRSVVSQGELDLVSPNNSISSEIRAAARI